MNKSNLLIFVVIVGLLASLSAIGQPIMEVIKDNAATNRAMAEAAKAEAEAIKIDAMGDAVSNVTLAVIAMMAFCINSVTLFFVVGLLYMIAKRDLTQGVSSCG